MNIPVKYVVAVVLVVLILLGLAAASNKGIRKAIDSLGKDTGEGTGIADCATDQPEQSQDCLEQSSADIQQRPKVDV